MKPTVGDMLAAWVPGVRRLRDARRARARHRANQRESARAAELAGKDIAAVFTDHYLHNEWANAESRSGPGSTLEYTASIRREIPALLARFGIKRVLDAPCGDYNWFRHIQRNPPFDYIGADIVEPLIAENTARYADAHTRFLCMDITAAPTPLAPTPSPAPAPAPSPAPAPAADLWLCRDCLFHLSYADVTKVLASFLHSGIPYLLTSSHTQCRINIDCITGSFRELNLELPPFNFPPPLASIDDWIGGFPVRQLCLWTSDQVRGALEPASVPSLKLKREE